MSTYVKFSGVYFWAFHGSVRNCLLHNMLSLQILTTVIVNPVRTMEHVGTLSTIINVTVLRVSTEPTVRPVWNLPLFISTLKINSISRGVFEVFVAYFSFFLNVQYWNSDTLSIDAKTIIKKKYPPNKNVKTRTQMCFIKSAVIHDYIFNNTKSFFSDIDECQSQPCQNNGTCQNQAGGYLCNCKAGFSGFNCESGE